MCHSRGIPAEPRSVRPWHVGVVLGCCSALLMCVSVAWADASRTQDWQTARRPLGVYAHVNIALAITRYLQTLPSHLLTGSCSALPAGIPPKQVHDALRQTYQDLLADDAVSGITAGADWCLVQLHDPACVAARSCPADSPDGYDWSYLDDVFVEAQAAHKSVRLLVTPGVNSPSWLLAKLSSCDGLFLGGTAGPDCGKVTFTHFPESQRANSHEFPLPWSAAYVSYWPDFLKHLHARYGSNSAFVAIAVAGPVGASTEMILPTTANKSYLSPATLPPSHPDFPPVRADTMWQKLIDNHFTENTPYRTYPDKVFVDSWAQTISAYEHIFAGVTLVVTPDIGDDMPEIGTLPTQDESAPLWNLDCAWNQTVSCEAKAQILANFVAAQGPNAKATDVGGMTASSVLTKGDIGLPGVKVLTSMPQSPPFLGGAEFDYAVSEERTRQAEGCPTRPTPNNKKPCDPLTTVEATFNVLRVLFDGTEVGDSYGGARGTEPLAYVDLDYVDIAYAQARHHRCPEHVSPSLGEASLQDLLSRASHHLFYIAGMSTLLPPPTCTHNQ